jgi:TPR repeat protein
MAGEGVVADVTKAVDWFDKASYQIPQAAINIGNMYRTGHMGTQKDLLRAQAYFKRHAHRDGICKALLDEVEKEISSNQS